jgi:hypothetical protein
LLLVLRPTLLVVWFVSVWICLSVTTVRKDFRAEFEATCAMPAAAKCGLWGGLEDAVLHKDRSRSP